MRLSPENNPALPHNAATGRSPANPAPFSDPSRRRFVSGAVRGLAGVGLVGALSAHDAPPPGTANEKAERPTFEIHPIGRVEKAGEEFRLRIDEEYRAGLLGLEEWSHVQVFYWFDKNDVPEKRRILQVHPRGNKDNPLTGVFACRAPVRPNLIALSLCRIQSVEGNVVSIDTIDAFEGTPILDLKPFTPPDDPVPNSLRVPAWARGGR